MPASVQPPFSNAPDAERVLTEAALRAKDLLGLSQKDFAKIIGVSPSFMSKLASSASTLSQGSKSFELAMLFVRCYRSLDAIVGGSDATAGQWMRTKNTALHGVPLELMTSVQGLVTILQYLDQRRAPL